jgi:hypothetical protein
VIDPNVRTVVEQAVGVRIVDWSARSAGLTHAATGVVTFEDGTTLFVKAGTDDRSSDEVRREIALLGALDAPFLPECRGAIDGSYPILLLEDLSEGHWPEPYPSDLSPLERALRELREMPVPTELALPGFEGPSDDVCHGLVEHAGGVAPGLVPWLESHADPIIESVALPSAGGALVHSDLWYSNLCFLRDRVVIVDWSHACVGSPWFDASTISIDLVIEGRRPLPMKEAVKWAATHLVWSLWALARGPGPGISNPDLWRSDNIELVDGAAWWVADELGLPTPPVLSDRDPGYR